MKNDYYSPTHFVKCLATISFLTMFNEFCIRSDFPMPSHHRSQYLIKERSQVQWLCRFKDTGGRRTGVEVGGHKGNVGADCGHGWVNRWDKESRRRRPWGWVTPANGGKSAAGRGKSHHAYFTVLTACELQVQPKEKSRGSILYKRTKSVLYILKFSADYTTVVSNIRI